MKKEPGITVMSAYYKKHAVKATKSLLEAFFNSSTFGSVPLPKWLIICERLSRTV